MVVLYTEDRLITCPYCRKNIVPKREELETQINFRCPKCKLVICVKTKRTDIRVIE